MLMDGDKKMVYSSAQSLVRTDTVDRIISCEWNMFQAVNVGGPRAECQDDYITFDGMRRGQFMVWSQEAASSYLEDLYSAEASGRNLVREKYIHMMRTTDPSRYKQLLVQIMPPSETVKGLAFRLTGKLLSQTQDLFDNYPYVTGSGRPLYSTRDFEGVISIETYQLGEFLTYSERTLNKLLQHVLTMEGKGLSFARAVLENSVAFYGYKTLEDAEAAAKDRLDR
jgi:hypothetical protein